MICSLIGFIWISSATCGAQMVGNNNTNKKEPIKRNLSALNGMTSESCDVLHYLIKFHGTISQFATFNWSVSLV